MTGIKAVTWQILKHEREYHIHSDEWVNTWSVNPTRHEERQEVWFCFYVSWLLSISPSMSLLDTGRMAVWVFPSDSAFSICLLGFFLSFGHVIGSPKGNVWAIQELYFLSLSLFNLIFFYYFWWFLWPWLTSRFKTLQLADSALFSILSPQCIPFLSFPPTYTFMSFLSSTLCYAN